MTAFGRPAIVQSGDGTHIASGELDQMQALRIRMPAAAIIGGVRYQVHDWGLDGFSLDGSMPRGRLGDRCDVTLQLMFDAFRLTFELSARVGRVADGGACEFSFAGLSPDHADAIRHVIDGWLAGEASPFGTVTAAVAPDAAAPRRGTEAARDRYSRLYRLTAGLAVCILVLAVLGMAAINRILNVPSQYAAVAADLTQVRAEQDGVLADAQVAAGQRVKKGMLLGYLHPAVSSQEREAMATQAVVVTARLQQERSALNDANSGFSNFKSVASTSYKSAKDAQLALDREVQTQASIVERYRGLAREGYVARLQADQQEETLHDLERQRAAAAANEEAARQSLANADSGIYGADGHLTQRTPSQIHAAIAELEAQQRQLTQQLSAMDTNLPVNAPCDCMVMAVHAANGQFVAKNGPIFDLGLQKDNRFEIDALVPANAVNALKVGNEARVLLADRKASVVGRIARINLNAANSGRIGLPDGLRSLDLYALVTVSIEAPGPVAVNESAGTPATVDFPIGIVTFARSIVGLQ